MSAAARICRKPLHPKSELEVGVAYLFHSSQLQWDRDRGRCREVKGWEVWFRPTRRADALFMGFHRRKRAALRSAEILMGQRCERCGARRRGGAR